MSLMLESKLKSGIIFGDNSQNEYVYLPAGECGLDVPVLIHEYNQQTEDIKLDDALRLIIKHSLKPTKHPILGETSI